jgi:hypothetical protein
MSKFWLKALQIIFICKLVKKCKNEWILKPKIRVEHTKQLEKKKRKLFHPHPKKEKANFIADFKLLRIFTWNVEIIRSKILFNYETIMKSPSFFDMFINLDCVCSWNIMEALKWKKATFICSALFFHIFWSHFQSYFYRKYMMRLRIYLLIFLLQHYWNKMHQKSSLD